MIEALEGLYFDSEKGKIILNVYGVFYGVHVTEKVINGIRNSNYGEKVILFTVRIIKDNSDLLFGFINHFDRDFFKKLIKVERVGAKTAIRIMETVGPDDIKKKDRDQLIKLFVGCKGIAQKTAVSIADYLIKNQG